MNFDLQLTGQRALVTGGTKGLGAAVVRGLREAGAQVIATARAVPAVAVDGVHYVAADLSTAEGTAEAARAVLEQWGGIDILVNVLGGSNAPAGGFAALDDAQWVSELNLNLMPAVRLDRAMLPAMLAQGSGVHEHGEGVSRDYAQAMRWYLEAARQGDSSAVNNVGLMYERGRGVEVDDAEAASWYRRAAEMGNPIAQNNLGKAFRGGRGVEKDDAVAVTWFRKAAEQGNAGGQSNLGRAYHDGRGYLRIMRRQ